MKAIGTILLITILFFVDALLFVWAAWLLLWPYGWFLEPLGFPEIGVVHLAGVLILVRFAATKGTSGGDDRTAAEKIGDMLVSGALRPLFFLVVLFILHRMFM